jgi:hypothetical protein
MLSFRPGIRRLRVLGQTSSSRSRDYRRRCTFYMATGCDQLLTRRSMADIAFVAQKAPCSQFSVNDKSVKVARPCVKSSSLSLLLSLESPCTFEEDDDG